MSALENKENDMYLCNCKKYFCDECKDEHLEKLEESTEVKHNLVNYNEKDYKCTCSEYLEDYYYYCKKCNKNLCEECEDDHRKIHSVINFSDELINNLREELINEKKNKYEEQKKNIIQCLTKIYNMKIILDKKIDNLIKTLNSYLEINNYILKNFNKSTLNEQIIENIKNINFKFPARFQTFTSSKDEKESLFFFF